MSEELTPWFPPQLAPYHGGYYDTRACGWGGELLGEIRLWWNAERRVWLTSPCSVNTHSIRQFRRWRGLANPPKGKK